MLPELCFRSSGKFCVASISSICKHSEGEITFPKTFLYGYSELSSKSSRKPQTLCRFPGKFFCLQSHHHCVSLVPPGKREHVRERRQASFTQICLSQNKVWKYSKEPSRAGTPAELPHPSQGTFPQVHMEGEWVWASLLSSLGERKMKLQEAAEPRNPSEACFL